MSTSVRRAIRSESLRWNETTAVCPGIIWIVRSSGARWWNGGPDFAVLRIEAKTRSNRCWIACLLSTRSGGSGLGKNTVALSAKQAMNCCISRFSKARKNFRVNVSMPARSPDWLGSAATANGDAAIRSAIAGTMGAFSNHRHERWHLKSPMPVTLLLSAQEKTL